MVLTLCDVMIAIKAIQEDGCALGNRLIMTQLLKRETKSNTNRKYY